MTDTTWLTGRVLFYDLSSDKSWIETISRRVLKLLYGGRALASYILYKYTSRDIDPFSPENPLVISPGVLVGTGLSTASKTTISAKSPLTGFLGRSSVGAKLGYSLRGLGFDALVVLGKLDTPGVLVIDSSSARVETKQELWGLRVSEARSKISKYYKGYSECIIGPAGENLSRIAAIDCNGRQAGRTGLGAVMGSKKLKAILVKIEKPPRLPNREKLLEVVRILNRELAEHPASKTLVEYGTPIMTNYTGKLHGVLPALNWKYSGLEWTPDPDKTLDNLAHWAPRLRKKRNPCTGCARVCSQVIELLHRGRSIEVDGPEYETVYALGTNLGFKEIEPIALLNYLADEYGFDTISLGVTLSWLTEAVERKDIDENILGEYSPEWSNFEEYAKIVEDMATRRTPLSRILADGVKNASEKLGIGDYYAMHVKGLELPAYDPRGLKGLALGYAVSSRGGDHLTSGAYAVEIPGKLWIYRDIDPRTTRGKALLVKEMENIMAVYDITGVCKFSRNYLTPDRIAEVTSIVLGEETTTSDLLLAGERTITIERLYNLREGLSPEQDTLPPRILEEAISSGPCRDCKLSREELEDLKKQYYLARGWSTDTGEPSAVRLVELGLDTIL